MNLPTWIASALEFGHSRKLIVAQHPNAQQYCAILDFGDIRDKSGESFKIGAQAPSADEALKMLDAALMEDAAKDMVDSGSV